MATKQNIDKTREKAVLIEFAFNQIKEELKSIRKILGQKGHIMAPRRTSVGANLEHSLAALVTGDLRNSDPNLAERLGQSYKRVRLYLSEM